jgi:ornithine cyclodeaminase
MWLTEQDVVGLLDLREAIAALEAALRAEAHGEAASMTKTLLQFAAPGQARAASNLHAIGGRLGALVGTKTWAHTDGGTSPLLILWDAANGSLVAVIEAFALGNLRTGGISGVATDWLAQPDARVLGLVGAGKQALSQAASVLAVRPIERLQVHSPRAESRAAFAAKARDEFGIEVVEAPTVAAACAGAQVVTLVTRAEAPFLHAAMLEPGAHLNAVGAIATDREEFAQDVFGRATCIAVDSLPGVQTLSREFITRCAATGWGDVLPLSRLIARGRRRTAADDVTLFKAMGMGLSDLALGAELVRRARERGAGRVLPQPKKAKPRLAAVRAGA